MIDENKLIKDVEYYISHTNETSGEHYAYIRCKQLVERQPKVGGWIPCSKRLPEETGKYLVLYDCGDEEGCMVVNFDAGIGSFGEWYDDYDNITLGFVDSEFIYCEIAVAWMPLPEPYKEDEP